MSQPDQSDSALRVADLPQNRITQFDLRPDPAQVQAIMAELDLLGLRKLRFRGTIRAAGQQDWQLEGTLGATVIQPCAVTLEPVITRIDEVVHRRYLADAAALFPEGEEIEMPDDDSAEPLGAVIDPHVVMIEALALALPLWPRAEGAAIGSITVTEPGQTPLTTEAMKPFAGLAGLRDQLAKPSDEDS
ncbi:MAG: YceD family protein [Rhodobacterales bacterium]